MQRSECSLRASMENITGIFYTAFIKNCMLDNETEIMTTESPVTIMTTSTSQILPVSGHDDLLLPSWAIDLITCLGVVAMVLIMFILTKYEPHTRQSCVQVLLRCRNHLFQPHIEMSLVRRVTLSILDNYRIFLEREIQVNQDAEIPVPVPDPGDVGGDPNPGDVGGDPNPVDVVDNIVAEDCVGADAADGALAGADAADGALAVAANGDVAPDGALAIVVDGAVAGTAEASGAGNIMDLVSPGQYGGTVRMFSDQHVALALHFHINGFNGNDSISSSSSSGSSRDSFHMTRSEESFKEGMICPIVRVTNVRCKDRLTCSVCLHRDHVDTDGNDGPGQETFFEPADSSLVPITSTVLEEGNIVADGSTDEVWYEPESEDLSREISHLVQGVRYKMERDRAILLDNYEVLDMSLMPKEEQVYDDVCTSSEQNLVSEMFCGDITDELSRRRSEGDISHVYLKLRKQDRVDYRPFY